MTITFNADSISTSLKVNDYFATLIKDSENFYTFQLLLKVKQSDIIQNSLSSIKIFARNATFEDTTSTGVGQDPNLATANNRITSTNTNRQQNIVNQDAIIAKTEVSLYRYVNAQVKSLILSGISPEDVESLYDFKEVLEKNTKPTVRVPSEINVSSIRSLNLELLSRYRIDPGSLINVIPNSNFIVEDLKKYYINEALISQSEDSEYFGLVKKVSFNDEIVIKTMIDLPKTPTLELGKVNFEISVYKENREDPINTKFVSIDVNQQKQYYQPNHNSLPKLSYAAGRLNVEQSFNPGKVSIKKKQMDGYGNGTFYTDFSTSNLEANQSFSFYTPSLLGKLEVYRCFNDVLNSNFSSAVVGENLSFDTTGLEITDSTVDGAIKLQLLTPPSYAEQVQIEKQTYNSSGLKIGEKDIVLPFSDLAQNKVIYDTLVKNGEVYEYFVKYLTRGQVRDSIVRLHQYSINSKNIPVSAKITNQTFSFINGEPVVSFTVQGSIEQNDQDKINAALKALDLYNDFADEIKQTREKFGSLLYLKIERISLKTGVRDAFDILPGAAATDSSGNFSISFSDSPEVRQKLFIPNLDLSSNYRYQVRAYFKNPLTLLRDYVKVGTSPSSKKPYAYRPYRFLQESTLQGTLPIEDADGNIIGFTSLIEQSDIGIVASTLVNGSSISTQLQTVTAKRVDSNKIKLSWSFGGRIENYDHFIVIKEVNKNRRILTTTTLNQHIDYFDKHDSGTVIYYVIPVLNDYSTTAANRSNSILIDPSEL